MLKSNKTAAALAAIMTVGVALAGSSDVYAAKPENGTTAVTYDNRTVLPDSNAQYGIIIPTAITFTDDSKTADASLEITGINGYDLDKDWTELQVTASVASLNGYKLKTASKDVDYKIKMTGNTDTFESTMQTPTTAKEITDRLGIGTGNKKKAEGTATLTGSARAKGSYTDTLTYSFVENQNTLK